MTDDLNSTGPEPVMTWTATDEQCRLIDQWGDITSKLSDAYPKKSLCLGPTHVPSKGVGVCAPLSCSATAN